MAENRLLPIDHEVYSRQYLSVQSFALAINDDAAPKESLHFLNNFHPLEAMEFFSVEICCVIWHLQLLICRPL